jgi:DDE_Tnp_1-associated
MERFQACFAELADPRTGNAQRHELLEILVIALCAVMCGAESCVDMALFGRAKEGFFRRFLRLPGGVPSPSIVSRSTLLAPVPAARSGGVRGVLRPVRGGVRGPHRRGGGGRRQDGAALVRPALRDRPASSDQRLGMRATARAGPAPGRRPQQRDRGAAGAARHAGARGPDRHRRCHALPA